MTGYTVHTGTSKKFVSGWDRVFGSSEEASSQPKAAKSKTKKQPGKSTSAKATGKSPTRKK
ncbi:MAG: hypothetical protein KDA91_18425 [Planctomycetaceae bacterium]|nr:hypothetical protein [Planctomycetaceae bacterium]